MHMHWYWFVCGILMILLEFAIPGLVICFFGVSALLVGGLVYFFPSLFLAWQLLIFAVFGLVLALLSRRLVPGGFRKTEIRSNGENIDDDAVSGENCRCTEAIEPGKPGKVEFRGSFWTASADEKIAVGELCIVEKRENLTLKVRLK